MTPTKQRKYQRVTPETEARILPFLRQFKGDKTATEIARLLGDVNAYAVKSVAARHGIKLRGKPGHITEIRRLLETTPPLTDAEIRRVVGCTRQQVNEERKRQQAK